MAVFSLLAEPVGARGRGEGGRDPARTRSGSRPRSRSGTSGHAPATAGTSARARTGTRAYHAPSADGRIFARRWLPAPRARPCARAAVRRLVARR